MSLNLTELFFQRAEVQPSHPAILGPKEGDAIGYSALRMAIVQQAEHLREAGVSKGTNIGLHFGNGQDYIVFTYALWACGATVTPIPVELAEEEKQQILKQIAIDAVITMKRLKTVFEPFKQGDECSLGEQALLIHLLATRDPPPQLAGINPAFIRFTSGTTGKCKGVVLSHETIYERINAANEGLGIGPHDRIVWMLSMAYHFTVSIVAYLSFGASIVLPRNAFGVSILRAADYHQATMIYAAPTHYELMTHDRSEQQLPDLRLAIVTTTRLSEQVGEAFFQRFGQALNETYGIIELGLPAVNQAEPRTKQGSVGQLLPAYQLKLEGEQGATEILLNGPGMIDAYYDPWQPRQEILAKRDGWFATGDLGVIDEQGYLSIVGRRKEMISVAGMKFFPQEAEAVLERHPAVAEACVFGVKVPRLGEVPRAHLVLAEGCQQAPDGELRDYCREHLASYKVPDEFHWVSELARTASGKLIRKAEKSLPMEHAAKDDDLLLADEQHVPAPTVPPINDQPA